MENGCTCGKKWIFRWKICNFFHFFIQMSNEFMNDLSFTRTHSLVCWLSFVVISPIQHFWLRIVFHFHWIVFSSVVLQKHRSSKWLHATITTSRSKKRSFFSVFVFTMKHQTNLVDAYTTIIQRLLNSMSESTESELNSRKMSKLNRTHNRHKESDTHK